MTTHATNPKKALPPRRAAFVTATVTLTHPERPRDADYAAKSAFVEASRLLGNADVQAEITRQRAILAEQTEVTPEKIVAELAVIAFADLGDYIRIHPDGTASIELGVLTTEQLRAALDTGVFEADSPALESGQSLPEERTGAEPRHEGGVTSLLSLV